MQCCRMQCIGRFALRMVLHMWIRYSSINSTSGAASAQRPSGGCVNTATLSITQQSTYGVSLRPPWPTL